MSGIRAIAALLLLCLPVLCPGQATPWPYIGAQVFIEPGQSREDIEEFFSIMEQNNMSVGRIRLFGAHMLRADGTWDYSLYDEAFDAAHHHGVRLFATLFPPTDLLSDVGGFKFPHSREHLDQIAEYIEAMVTHFSAKPALYTWVLQNEPGLGSANYRETDLSRQLYRQWEQEQRPPAYDNGYLKADFSGERFLLYYTNWYLNWIAGQVERHHPGSLKHINPHQIFETLPEYDFGSYEGYLTSMGISMHFSWHFGLFDRPRYPLGVSIMSDLISGNAGSNPFWITEMQGGNVTASGYVPYCPTGDEIARFLWTGIGAGTEGVIFWTLNQRASALEAGEWGLIDFYRRPSDRLSAASRVAALVRDHGDFFAGSAPAESAVTILYNNESLWIQRRNAQTLYDPLHEGRAHDAPQRSMIAAYEAVSAHGVTPAVMSMDRFDWTGGEGRTAIIPNVVSIPSRFWEPMERFVAGGGRLIVTGLSGFYDENMYCLPMNGFPLGYLFGGGISEYKFVGDLFTLRLDEPGLDLGAHMWRGVIDPTTARILGKESGEPLAARNVWGGGEVIWLPSLIELGARTVEQKRALREFYGWAAGEDIARSAVRFAGPSDGVFMRVLESPAGVMTVVVNRNDTPCTVTLTGVTGRPFEVDGTFTVDGQRLTVGADSYSVCIWNER